MHMYMYVPMYICICIGICICLCICICICIYVYGCTYVYIYTHRFTYAFLSIRMRMSGPSFFLDGRTVMVSRWLTPEALSRPRRMKLLELPVGPLVDGTFSHNNEVNLRDLEAIRGL